MSEEEPRNVEGYRKFQFPVILSVVMDVEASGIPLPQPGKTGHVRSRISLKRYGVPTDVANAKCGPAAYNIAETIFQTITMVLARPPFTVSDYSEYLFANVDELHFSVGGRALETIDVGYTFNPRLDSHGCFRYRDDRWVSRAMERRRREGIIEAAMRRRIRLHKSME